MREKPTIVVSALYGGLIMGVISALPVLKWVNCLCCAGILFGGFMAVFFYKKELMPDMPPLTNSDGLQLGALAGLFGGIIGIVLSYGLLALIGNPEGRMMLEFLERFRDSMPAESWDQMEEGILEGKASAFQHFIGLIVDVIFGLLGGLIGYSILKPKKEMMNVQPPSQPTV